VLKQKKKPSDGMDVLGSLGSGMNPMMSQMGGVMPDAPPHRGGANPGLGQMTQMGQMPGQMGGMMKGPGAGAGGVSNMSEDEYVRVWENYSKMSGRPFDAQTVRGWYRQYKGR
jgi:hypothetical protein